MFAKKYLILILLFFNSCFRSLKPDDFNKIGQFKIFILKNEKLFDELNEKLVGKFNLENKSVTLTIDHDRKNEKGVLICDTLSYYFKKLNLNQIHLTEYSTEFSLINNGFEKPYDVRYDLRKYPINEIKTTTIFIKKIRKNKYIIASKW